MSLSKFESDIKHLSVPAETVYERCADLRNLESLKSHLDDPALAQQVAGQVPDGKLDEVKKYINDITFEQDAISLASPVGQLVLRIVEREPKCIKFASEGSPIPLYVWIQTLPEGDAASKLKVTVGAEVNIFMKGMVSKPLQQAADGLANVIAAAMQAPQSNA
ncbi:MAG: hypothetical protein Q4E59_02425 [Bacteroidales bacterium]|nr:hypothetical protein [Bacteroidales bacterium]